MNGAGWLVFGSEGVMHFYRFLLKFINVLDPDRGVEKGNINENHLVSERTVYRIHVSISNLTLWPTTKLSVLLAYQKKKKNAYESYSQ